MLLLVAVVGALGTTLAGNQAWITLVSDFASTPLQTGWETSPGIIFGFIGAWIVIPVLLFAAPRLSARWLALVGLIEVGWAFLSARSIDAPGLMWFSPRPEAGPGPGAFVLVGIVAAGLALAIPPAEPLPAVDPTP